MCSQAPSLLFRSKYMPTTDKHSNAVSDEDEDRALFQTYGGPIAIDLLPQMFQTDCNDLTIRGLTSTAAEVLVVISGRRVKDTGPLIAQLKHVEASVRKSAAAIGRAAPDIERMRLPVQIKGAWRQTFSRDQTGAETRSYQLLVARWAFTDSSGNLMQYGEAPAIMPRARTRAKSYILSTREIDARPQSLKHDGGNKSK